MNPKKKNVLILVILSTVLSLTATGCGGDDYDDVNGNSSSSTSYSYQFSENGCDTGKHTFDSLQAECDGLQSDSLNKGCALRLRQDYFSTLKCTGSFSRKS